MEREALFCLEPSQKGTNSQLLSTHLRSGTVLSTFQPCDFISSSPTPFKITVSSFSRWENELREVK